MAATEEMELARRNQTIAIWTLAATVASSFLIAVIGIGGSYLVSHSQQVSSAEQGREDFLRSQRQVAYANLIAEAQKLMQLEHQALSERTTSSSGQGTFVNGDIQTLRLRYLSGANLLLTDLATVRLVASDTVGAAAEQVVEPLQHMRGVVLDTVVGLDPGSPATITSEQRAQANNLRQQTIQGMEDLVDAGRSELGASG